MEYIHIYPLTIRRSLVDRKKIPTRMLFDKPQWRRAKLPDPGNDHLVFPEQPVVSADRCPTYVCPILPAAVSSRLMARPFSLNYDGNVHSLPPHRSLVALCRLGVHASPSALLSSPPPRCKWIHHRVAFNRIPGVANNVHHDDHRIVLISGWKYIRGFVRVAILRGEEG